MKKSISERLNQLMSERNLKQVDILRKSLPYQKELNIKMAKSTLSQYVNGVQTPDQDRIYLLSKTLDVNEPWLMGYDVSKERIPDNERANEAGLKNRLFYIHNRLNLSRQIKLVDYAVFLYEEQEQYERNREYIEEYNTIQIQSKLSAGTGIIDLDPHNTDEHNYKGYIPNHDLAFMVSGNSMEPLFEDGEIIFVEKTSDVRNGQVIAVQINEEAYIKKVYKENNHLRLVSLNKDYNDIIANEDDDIRVIGRVIL